MALTRLPSFTIDSTSSFTFANVIVTSNVAAANANLGNSVTANYFIGNGSLLTGLPASYTDSNVAAYLPTFTGNIAANVITATSFSGNGIALTSVDAVTLNGFASTSFATAAQGTKADSALQAADLTGYATESYVGNSIANLIASAPAALDTLNELANALGNDASFSTSITNSLANKLSTSDFTSTANTWISTQSTSNLSEGTNLYYTETRANSAIDARVTKTFVDNLAVVANIANVAYSVSGANVSGTVANATYSASAGSADSVAGANVSGQVGNALIAGTVYTNAQPNITSVGNLSSLTVDNGSYGNVVITQFASIFATGNGPNPRAIYQATAADGVTGIGIQTYSGLNGQIYSNTGIIFTTGATIRDKDYPTGGTTRATIDSTGLSVTGDITGNYIIGNGSQLTGISATTANSVSGANVSGQVANALIAGTVYTNAQPNITSVGTLTALSVTANVVAGNILTDNLLYSNGTAWSLGSGGGGSSAPLAMNGDSFTGDGSNVNFSLSVTPSSSYYTIVTIGGVAQPRSFYSVTGNVITFSTAPPNNSRIDVTTFGGNASYMSLATAVTNSSQPNITSVGTLTSLVVTGNVTANKFIGDGSLLTNISASTSGTVTTAAQPNITSVGTLTSLSVTGNITSGNANLGNLVIANFYSGNGSLLSSITGANVSGTVANATYAVTAGTANSVAGANVSGTVALATSATSATTAGTVTTAAQPNITSTGTLSSLAVSGNATFSSWITLQQSSEVINTKNGATGTVEHDLSTGSSFYHTSPSANFTANFTNVSTTDSRAIVTALVIIQGSTPYVANAVQIDGAAQTIKWIGSTAPTGTASKTDVISFTLMRVGGIWSVYGQYSSYG